MSDNRRKLQEAYDAFARADFEAAFANLDEECTFHNGSDLLPAGGDFHGKREIVGRWLPELGANYENLRLSIDEMIGDGDAICVCGTSRSTVAGVVVKSPFCHVWHYRNGKVIDARFHTQQVEALVAIQRKAGMAAGAR